MGQAMFLMHFIYILYYGDSSNHSRISTVITTDTLALRLSSFSPRIHLTTIATVALIIIISDFPHSQGVLSSFYIYLSKPRDRKWVGAPDSLNQVSRVSFHHTPLLSSTSRHEYFIQKLYLSYGAHALHVLFHGAGSLVTEMKAPDEVCLGSLCTTSIFYF